jgi:hypothetical protein
MHHGSDRKLKYMLITVAAVPNNERKRKISMGLFRILKAPDVHCEKRTGKAIVTI